MKIKFNKKTNLLTFGNYGKIQFQNGSLIDHKENGVKDTDLIAGLYLYLKEMDHQHHSLYTETAVESLHAAFVLLDIRRGASHAKAKKESDKQ